MTRLSDNDLWPVIYRLAQQHPDSTGDLVSAVLQDAAGAKAVALWHRALPGVTDDRRPITLRDAFVRRRLDRYVTREGSMLLYLIAGMQAAGTSWSRITEIAPASHELSSIELSRRRLR